jgi:phosphatidylglycerophosphatase C
MPEWTPIHAVVASLADREKRTDCDASVEVPKAASGVLTWLEAARDGSPYLVSQRVGAGKQPLSDCAADRPMQINRTLAAFDFDGTITTSDSLRDFVRHTVGNARFAMGVLLALPSLVGMLVGLCDRATAKARFLVATIGGMARTELEVAAQQYAARRLPALIRPEMAARINEHKRRGHRLILVSASPALYLKHWAVATGFDAVLATELELRDGRFSGRLASPNCWGPEKARQLQQWFGNDQPRVLFAYGDSRGDQEMLALADYAWLRGLDAMPPIDAWPHKTAER